MAQRRRKGRGLGSSASTHTREGERAAYTAIAASGDTVRAINRGRCDLAFKHLRDALHVNGEAYAHAKSNETRVIRELDHNVATATATFKKHCLK